MCQKGKRLFQKGQTLFGGRRSRLARQRGRIFLKTLQLLWEHQKLLIFTSTSRNWKKGKSMRHWTNWTNCRRGFLLFLLTQAEAVDVSYRITQGKRLLPVRLVHGRLLRLVLLPVVVFALPQFLLFPVLGSSVLEPDLLGVSQGRRVEQYLDTGFGEVDPHGDVLPGVDIRVVGLHKGPLQFLNYLVSILQG